MVYTVFPVHEPPDSNNGACPIVVSSTVPGVVFIALSKVITTFPLMATPAPFGVTDTTVGVVTSGGAVVNVYPLVTALISLPVASLKPEMFTVKFVW